MLVAHLHPLLHSTADGLVLRTAKHNLVPDNVKVMAGLRMHL